MKADQKIRILYVITKSNWGGAQKYVYELATNLDKEIFDVTVLLGGKGELKQKLDVQKIPTLSIKQLARDIDPIHDISVFFELLSIFRKEKPNVVHLNSSKIGGLGAFAARIAGVKKIIFTAHGWAFNENRSFFSKTLIKFIYWITLSLCHRTITVSEGMKVQIKNFPFVQRKISVIHNGIGKINFYERRYARNLLAERNEKIKKILMDEKLCWIGTVSELHKNKGLEYIIEAIARVAKNQHQFIFMILGEGEERERLEKIVREKELEDTVIFMGHVHGAEHYLKALDIFTLTSITEALAYVILEAGQAGLPVLASAVGGIPEVVDDMESGLLIRAKNSREIEQGLTFLIQNEEKRKNFGETLQKKILKEFTLEKMLEETSRLYK